MNNFFENITWDVIFDVVEYNTDYSFKLVSINLTHNF